MRSGHDFGWQSRARCLGLPTDVFFDSDGDRGARRIAREQHAKQICNLCPVLRDCLAFALTSGQQYGVWGSMTPRERSALGTTPPTGFT
ncbi:WhiB family transcriptional regulator [Mycolicibacterium sp. S2-37]|uniref:WhiB family transcriptional regulator n=1 Tax=Mycolicibacterium sp. S2-37 TaxID=2810297 RepID=UPI001A95002C|nr:WhiB family transcriptional regulator [Mycolicibacterium sp. S2-37]MBO0680827.1 WhiB family transcriptional regulator [Mycolicibacterium sp. S2-37]